MTIDRTITREATVTNQTPTTTAPTPQPSGQTPAPATVATSSSRR